MRPSDTELLKQARRRVKLKTGFFIHLSVYVLVNLGLAAANLAAGGRPWHLWPLAGWGLGLAIHGLVTFAGLQGDGLRGLGARPHRTRHARPQSFRARGRRFVASRWAAPRPRPTLAHRFPAPKGSPPCAPPTPNC